MIDFDLILKEKSRFRFYSIFSVFSIERVLSLEPVTQSYHCCNIPQPSKIGSCITCIAYQNERL